MKKTVMKEWVTALRSGKYKQGRHQLKTSKNEYCCLGVLCKLSGLAKFNKLESYLDADVALPEQVMKWAGIKDSEGKLPKAIKNDDGSKSKSLAQLNDNGASFEEISYIIEKEYKCL